MLSLTLATRLVRLFEMYLAVGGCFAVPFALRFVNRLDAVAAHGTPVFRLLVIPGAVLLWPLLLVRLLRGDTAPPMERTAHRSGTR
jgi:hypothetical protein